MLLLNRVLNLLKSTFNRGQAAFMVSSAASQLFPLMAAPIITRLYSPEDFGVYAVFYALSSIFSGVSLLALNNAILMEKDRRQGAHMAAVALCVAVAFSLTLGLIVWSLPSTWISNIFGLKAAMLINWLPVAVLASGVFQCLNTWAVYQDKFSLLARNKLVFGISSALFQIAIGVVAASPIGFVFANLLGFLLAISLLALTFVEDLNELKPRLSWSSAVRQVKHHSALPLYTVPASLVNMTSSFVPDFMINYLYGAAQLGQYSLANRMIQFPLSFVTSSLQEVFRQRASQELAETGVCTLSYNRFFLILSGLAFLLIAPLVFVVPPLFPVIFGVEWREAGTLVEALSFLIAVRFVSSPLSFVWILRRHQKLDLFWQIGLLAIGGGALWLPQYIVDYSLSLYESLCVYSIAMGLWYACCVLLSRKIAYRHIA